MLEINHIQKSFGDHEVLRDVNFEVAEQSIVGLIGPSGSGKSVLIKIIAGVSPPDSGQIRFEYELPENASLMFQEGALFDSLTVFDNIAFPLVNGRVPSANLPQDEKVEVTGKVEVILGQVGLVKAAFKYPGQLSGGMRRRVSLARALVSRPKLVLLDDPTSGLDPVASSVIMELIVELHQAFRPTMLLVSHDLRRLLPVIQRVYFLDQGRIQFSGSVDELTQKSPAIIRSFVACRYSGCAPIAATTNSSI